MSAQLNLIIWPWYYLGGKKMCKSWCQPFSLGAHHYFDFKGLGSWVEFSSFWRRIVLFLFVCFPTPKVGDYFVFESHKWVRFSCFFFFVCVCVGGGVCVCVLFFLQNVRFPHYISRVRLNFFFLSRRLVKFFAFFHFCLFLFYFVLFCFF